MLIETEIDIVNIFQNDNKSMQILKAARTLKLPDWWICAGFVRSKIWDALHGYTSDTSLPDVDVIYFNPEHTEEKIEKEYEAQLKELMPDIPWSVKNEARMHKINNFPPYTSAVDAISKFPETATALGVKLNEEDQVILTAPWGVEDVLNLAVKPTPFFKETGERAKIYEERIIKKNWKALWPNITIFHLK